MSQENHARLMTGALEALLSATPDVLFIKDADLRYVAASQPFAQLIGLRAGCAACGKTDAELMPDIEVAREWMAHDQQVLQAGMPILERMERVPCPDGQERYMATSRYPVFGSDGKPVGLVGIQRDMDARAALLLERERRAVTCSMFDAVLEVDLETGVMLSAESARWPRMLSLLASMGYDRALRYIVRHVLTEEDGALLAERCGRTRLLTDAPPSVRAPLTVALCPDAQSQLYLEIFGQTVTGQDGRTRLTAFVRDVTPQINLQRRLTQNASMDALTGLLNRAAMLDAVETVLASGGQHALLFLDLDAFKQVNDQLGHSCGDGLLRCIAQRFRQRVRTTDLVGRFGGDEFLILLRDVSSIDAVVEKVTDLLTAFPFSPPSCPEQAVTCSVGVCLSRPGLSAAALLDHADRAMYQAKHAGANRYAVAE